MQEILLKFLNTYRYQESYNNILKRAQETKNFLKQKIKEN